MASSLTHYIFNKEVLKDLEDLDFLKDNEDIYILGAQGPDPFFFFGIVPIGRKEFYKEKREFGTQLHKISPEHHFKVMFEFANKQNEETKDFLYAYILGAGLHYLLDCNIHPYVFYQTQTDIDKDSFYYHTNFETNLDVVLLSQKYNKYKTSPAKAIKADKEKVWGVSLMYYNLARMKIINEFVQEDTFLKAVKEMKIIENILYSRFGIKKFFYNLIMPRGIINSMSHPLKVKDAEKIDYLNSNKSIWHNPGSNESFDLSVEEIFDKTKQDLKLWKQIVIKAYQNEIDMEELNTLCDNMTYDGIKNNQVMKYYDCVYEKNK